MSLHSFTHAFEVGGQSAVASVSPCSWMYPGYGLQVEVRVAGGQVFFNDNTTLFEDATEADVVDLAERVKLCPCAKCGKPSIDNPKSNRGGQCEACFSAMLDTTYAARQATAARREAAADRKQAAKGYRFKTVAWVHPSDGDDYQISWYSVKAPTAAEVTAVLKRRRSETTTDYQTVTI